MTVPFPRGTDAPAQSPLFWVNNKDRYLRQLLIRDIQAETNRELIVYFTDCDRSNAEIDNSDDNYLSELLTATGTRNVDLLIETNGGQTDATEKLCSLLRNANLDLRVIVPRRAKSNGTVLAFCGKSIVMGPESELGPIDPSVFGVPADYIVKIATVTNPAAVDPVKYHYAMSVLKQTKDLAKSLLSTGMLKGIDEADIDVLIDKLAGRDHYPSHGTVIDSSEAATIGLKIEALGSDSSLWQKLRLLRTMYAYDCQQRGHLKLFESEKITSPVMPLPQPAKP